MPKPKVVLLSESPDDHSRTWDAVHYIFEPIEERYRCRRMSVLPSDPKNGKAATKTELKSAQSVLEAVYQADFVLLVGNTPLQLVTGKAGISRARGTPFYRGKTLFLPINNPSVIKHDPKHEALIKNDVKLFGEIIDFGGIPQETRLNPKTVASWDQVDALVESLTGLVSFDIETTCLYPWQRFDSKGNPDPAKITMLGFGTRKAQWALPVSPELSPWLPHEIDRILDRITEALDECVVACHNGKFDMLWMKVHYDVDWRMDFDTMLAHFLLDENSRHGLKHLAQVCLGAPDWEVGLDTKKGKGSVSELTTYLAHDVYYTRQLAQLFSKQLKRDPEVHRVFDKILMPCANLFVNIEYDGVFIDMDQFEEAEATIREQYESALEELKQWEPQDVTDSRGRRIEFNWGSPKQLGELLYDRLKLPVIERTKTGGRSCSESVIKRLDHPCTEALLKFRGAKQQLSFFIEGWKPYLTERPDGYYLHPSFKLHGTVTGRLSCENPNLQQVPRDPRIRTLISAPKGWTLVECDLSQIELRIAAELAGERTMIYAFTHGIDVHWLTGIKEIERGGGMKEIVLDTARTAMQDQSLNYAQSIQVLLKIGHERAISINKDWKEIRKKAKAINFGFIYGMWWKKFKDYARDNYGITLTDEQAEGSRNTFFDEYSDLSDWHRRQRNFSKRHGYVKSLSGRKRRLPEAQSSEPTPESKEAQRQAINSPVQSFANEINLMAAIQLSEEYGRDKVRICGTVHDAVLFRVKNSYVEEVYHRMLEIMQRPKLMDEFEIEMSVPIEADGEIGPWGAGVPLEEWKRCRTSE